MTTKAEQALAALFAGEPTKAAGLLPPLLVVDDPVAGHELHLDGGVDAATRAAAALAGRGATVRSVTTGEGRTVLELVVPVIAADGTDLALPVAVVVDTSRIADCTCVRSYYARALLGGSVLRLAFLATEQVELPPVLRNYQAALSRGDFDGLLATLAPEISVQEPSGGRHIGQAAREFYRTLLADGGLHLQNHACTQQGLASAVEYSVVRYGSIALAPQAGLGMYVCNEAGLITEVRLYDDPVGP